MVIGWIVFPSYAALMALGLVAGLGLTGFQARQAGPEFSRMLDAALAGVLAGVLAGRAGYVIENWRYFEVHRDQIAQIWQGGLAWHAALGAGLALFLVWGLVRRQPVAAWLDCLAPGLVAAIALGWLGAHLAGVGFGREVMPDSSWWPLAADLPDIYGLRNPRFAVQLLAAGWSACVLILVLALRRPGNGTRFAAALALYGAGMFVLDGLRGDAAPLVAGWRLDQLADGLLSAAATVWLLLHYLISHRGHREHRGVF